VDICDGDSAQDTSIMPLPGNELSDMGIRLDTVRQCDRQTDRRTSLLTQYRALPA